MDAVKVVTPTTYCCECSQSCDIKSRSLYIYLSNVAYVLDSSITFLDRFSALQQQRIILHAKQVVVDPLLA